MLTRPLPYIGFTQVLASNLRLVIADMEAVIFHSCYLLVALDCCSESEVLLLVHWQSVAYLCFQLPHQAPSSFRSLLLISKPGDKHWPKFMNIFLYMIKLHLHLLSAPQVLRCKWRHSFPVSWKLVRMYRS